MRVKQGSTRLVLLYGSRAYKVGRTKFISTTTKLIKTVCRQSEIVRLTRKHKGNIGGKIFRQCFAGLYANRAEARYWEETHDDRCVPVVGVWLGGFIIVQERAEAISAAQIYASPLRELTQDKELCKPCQYGLSAGVVKVVDYAHWRLNVA